MNETRKNAFVLNKPNSPYVEQVILILKEDALKVKDNADIVREAERIVDTYLKNSGFAAASVSPLGRVMRERERLLSLLINGSIAAGVLLLMFMAIKIIIM